MRLLILAYDFKPNSGGIAEVTHQFAFHLHRRGHPVRVISRPLPGDAQFDQAVPYSVARSLHWKTRPWQRLKFLRAEIEKWKTDFILSNVLGSGSVWGSLFSRRKDCRFLIYAHGMDLARRSPNGDPVSTLLRIVRQRISFRGAHRVLCQCSQARETLLARGIDEAKLSLIFPAVAPDFLEEPGIGGQELRRRWGLENRFVILSLCRLVERKGIDLMLKAMARLVPRFPELRYLVAGSGPDGDRLEALARDLGIKGQVTFAGAVPEKDKRDYFDGADLFAMPNRDLNGGDCEGFGLVFLEAAARGKAVIGGRAGGVSDSIQEGNTGLLVKPGDVDDLTCALEGLLSDPHRRRQMGERGRERVLRHFTWDHVIDKFTSEILNSE